MDFFNKANEYFLNSQVFPLFYMGILFQLYQKLFLDLQVQ